MSVYRQRSLSRILAVRMIAVSVAVSILLTVLVFIHYMVSVPQLHEATLHRNAYAIAQALGAGQDPAKIPLYRDYPQSYGFRVFDTRNLVTRRILASANTRWLPAVDRLPASAGRTDRSRKQSVGASDLMEGFDQFRPRRGELPEGSVVSLEIHRVVLPGHKYWVQAYMIGDPAWAGLGIIIDKVISHVLFPLLAIVPALTLAIFLTTRGALRPLRQLSGDANVIGNAVARGRTLVPVSGQGMAREFSDVANAINTMLEMLERSLKLQKQFTSDAAHELRTPLAVLLLEVSQLPPSPARERIKTDLEELANLVNELLRFAQAEDAMAHERERVDVVATARKVCEDAAVTAVASRQLIEFDYSAVRTDVPGNGSLIEIAIRNLVDNALKYSPANSTVSVRIDPGPVVIVEDEGEGIPLAQRDRIFERFWRANRTARMGAGVGLALVRRIAQLHNGNVRLEDRSAGGTRMIMDLSGAHLADEAPQMIASA